MAVNFEPDGGLGEGPRPKPQFRTTTFQQHQEDGPEHKHESDDFEYSTMPRENKQGCH